MIVVGSLKFSPVYKSHCCAFGKACEEAGYPVSYLFSHEYAWMLSEDVKEKTLFIGGSVDIPSMLKDTLSFRNIRAISKAFSKDKITHVYMHNYHFLNHYIAKSCRKNGCKFIYHAHEPYVENKSAHGGLQQYWLHLNEFAEERLLKNTDVAVVSSKEASRLFEEHCSWFKGKRVQIPLMYEDLGVEAATINERKYITFVGPPVPAKGPEIFLKIVDYSSKHSLGLSFLLISRMKIKDSEYRERDNLTVFCRERMSDEEFGDLIRKSLMVLTPYKRETQSSVVLVSYMYGTPVVSSDVGGIPEFVNHGKTGYLVSMGSSIEEWINGIFFVLENHHKMTVNCRNYFVETSSGKNWGQYLSDLLA